LIVANTKAYQLIAAGESAEDHQPRMVVSRIAFTDKAVAEAKITEFRQSVLEAGQISAGSLTVTTVTVTINDVALNAGEGAAQNSRPYTYTFTPWPNEMIRHPAGLFRLFEALKCSIKEQFTEAEFALFRGQLAQFGLTLREISRVPYVEPEAVL
jgi:hypothetical protein